MASPVVVMGVSGSGKSTVGAALAQRLRVPFADADDFHPPANIAKMSAGHPLNDDDRRPWLESIGKWLADHPDGGVMSCSALKRAYRDQLRDHCPARSFPPPGRNARGDRPAAGQPAGTLHARLAARIAVRDARTAGDDENGVAIDVDQNIDSIVDDYVSLTNRRTDEHRNRLPRG